MPLPASVVPTAVYDKPASERSVFKTNGADGALAAFAGVPGSPNVSSIAPPEPVSNADVAVGQHISYWISQDVQNAQMKLDGFGDEPVEVNIRMQGNEAHIAFRSDEAQTRAALEHAGDHLRELLQKEGVTLAGVSVGTSASGESGTQERKPRQGVRQAVVAIAPLEPEVARVRPGAGGTRAVDLFV
jgi:flagellar hook-length control protein FliK